MPTPCYLGIDLGTSSVKAVFIGTDGARLASARAEYPIATPLPDRSESQPDAWWDAVQEAVAHAARLGRYAPSAIGLSGQMHGVVLCDPAGAARGPAILWSDRRAETLRAGFDRLPAARRARLANPWSPGMAGPILAWLAGNDPTALASSRWALQPKDWLRLILTGRAGTEPSDASATLLYDVAADGWDTAAVDHFGVPERLLPPLGPSSGVAGRLSRSAAECLGLDEGIPVIHGAGDTAAAILGNGLGGTGSTQLTLGTGGQLVTLQARPQPDAAAGINLFRSAAPEGWYAMAAVLNAGLALGWVCDTLQCSWDELYAAADRPTRNDDPIFLPYLVGERTPYLSSGLRGGWYGLQRDTARDAMLRAALEGVALSVRAAADALPGVAATAPLRIAGGGTSRSTWRQLLADVLGHPLSTTTVTDASARGAALLAAIGIGDLTYEAILGDHAPPLSELTEPRPDRVGFHEGRLAHFQALVDEQLQRQTA